MKTLLVGIIFSITIASAHQASLGKLLSRKYAALSNTDQEIVLIYLTDKGNTTRYTSRPANSFVTEHSIQRRSIVRNRTRIIDEGDFPLEQSYVRAIARNVVSIRHELKWFNAVSVVAAKSQIEILRQLPFVKEVELVGRWGKKIDTDIESIEKSPIHVATPQATTSLDYGPSFAQNNQINVPPVHNLGIYGQGVVIGMFDNGVRFFNHEAFASMTIIAQHDFVDHKESVIPNNPSTSTVNFGGHGLKTLSLIGGYKPGQLIGPAFKSSFILARTENDSSETPIEEDNWAAAIQWADSIGVDVTSTSLGYLAYQSPYTSWTWQDMNGNTTLITRAADHAVELGIVVLNAAGNDGYNASHNTLGAPADGDSVITVGAIDASGNRAGFSSVGPTTDVPPRIKPDVMALGSGNYLVSTAGTTFYTTGNGTSYATPLAAGIAALIRCANPSLTPMQVRDAMRNTASQASTPDNLMGWGILNADSAIKYFGITPRGKMSGIVFYDTNGNGIKDGAEAGIANVKIYLTGDATDSTLTDANGHYLFDTLAIGTFTVTETLPPGLISTYPLNANSYTVMLLLGVDSAGLHFGNSPPSEIHGTVFNDTTLNGIRDNGEVGVANWVIKLSGADAQRVVTDTFGHYAFTNLLPGAYAVSESLQFGWHQTFPSNGNSHLVVLRGNMDTTGLDFGIENITSVTFPVMQGWNLLSLPGNPVDHTKTVLYPTANSEAFLFTDTYVPADTIPNGQAYWLSFPNTQNVTTKGEPRTTETLSLMEGWNLVGTLSFPVPVSQVVDGGGILTSPFFGFNGSYVHADTLQPHGGYWIKTSAAGDITLDTIQNITATLPKQNEALLSSLNTLTFHDAAGKKQTLYFGSKQSDEIFFELPPVPPNGVFDVRFSSGKFVWAAKNHTASAMQIIVQGITPPLDLSWNIQNEDAQYDLMTVGKLSSKVIASFPGHTGQFQINDLTDNLFSIRITEKHPLLPTSFALEQNYPNPFNPLTVIRYSLPVQSHVSLKVYNVLGQEVAVLVDEMQEAGYKSAEWDVGNVPSGVYFYRLAAGHFTQVRTMVVMK